MLDTNLLFSNNVNLSATGFSSILDLRKTPGDGVEVEIANVGTVTGTTPTLDAVVQHSDSPTFASGIVNGPAFPQVTTTAQRNIVRTQSKKRYARISYTLTGTTPVFNGVTAGIVSGGQRDTTA